MKDFFFFWLLRIRQYYRVCKIRWKCATLFSSGSPHTWPVLWLALQQSLKEVWHGNTWIRLPCVSLPYFQIFIYLHVLIVYLCGTSFQRMSRVYISIHYFHMLQQNYTGCCLVILNCPSTLPSCFYKSF